MTDYTVSDILDFSATQQPLKVGDAFDAVMRDKISQRLEAHKEMLAQSMFNDDEDEDFEDDIEVDEDDEDDLEIDDEDLDALIDDEDDFEDDDDIDDTDLDDLDIDLEDDTDEDS